MYKIYKIVDNTNDNIYIGITTQTLKRRLSDHEIRKKCSSREIIKNGDYRIELIEETDDKTRERYWILNTNCINITIPGRTDKEYREDNKEKQKKQKIEWYKNNKDYNKHYNKFRSSWGGDPRTHNNLLKIDPHLFN